LGVFAFSQQFLFRDYGVNDGLESNTVYDIAQDNQGFMWFATKGALTRFDSQNFKTFKKNVSDSLSIGNSFIRVIKNFSKDSFLLGTERGIYLFDLKTEAFKRIHPDITNTIYDILVEKDGYWIATDGDGVFFYNTIKKEIKNYSSFGDFGKETGINRTRAIAKDDTGRLWIGTYGNGVFVLNFDEGTVLNYKAGNELGALSNNFILNMYKGLDGTIWFGTLGGGLNYWSVENKRFYNYKFKEGENSISDNIVLAVNQRDREELLIGTEKGLSVLNLNSNRFTSYKNTPDSKSLSDNPVWSIFIDKEKNVWIGTYFGGVNYLNLSENTIKHFYKKPSDPNSLKGNAVSSFYEGKDGNLWIGTEDGGLNHFNPKKGEFLELPEGLNSENLSYTNVHSVIEDKQGQLWIGIHSGGLDVYNPITKKITNYKNDGIPNSISNNSVFHIFQDSKDRVWLGTLDGLNIYDDENGFIRVNQLDKIKINVILEDSIGTIWIATNRMGLYSYNYELDLWTKHNISLKIEGLEQSNIISLMEDARGYMWIGLEGEGLLRYNLIDDTLERVDLQSKIETVYSILEDHFNGIWMSSNKGILYYNYETKKIIHYTDWDYLQSKQFNYGAGFIDSNGNFYFGGINGFNVFKPEKLINDNLKEPYGLIFTQLKINNQQIDTRSKNYKLNKVINHTSRLELNHNQTFLNIEFSDINYQAPKSMNFEYKMEGFDSDWNNIEKDNKAIYTNIPPGDYVFKVRSDNGHVQKSNEMGIHIAPPFYKHTLAYVLYALLLVSGLFLLSDFLKKRAIIRNNIRLEKFKREEEKMFFKKKLEFFTDMAHEIRTPLTLITSPLDLILEDKVEKNDIPSQLVIMKKNSDRLQILIDHLLDFRRVESDSFKLTKRNVDLVNFIEDLYSRFSGLANKKGIQFEFSSEEGAIYMDADTEALTKIFSNLLSNAFKFARTKVAIGIETKFNSVENKFEVFVSVKDDGIGIPKHQEKDIFNRFFKVVEGEYEYNNLGGTGIGLSIAKLLTEMHGGRLEVDSMQGESTIFKVALQINEFNQNTALTIDSVTKGSSIDESNKVHVLIVEDSSDLLSFLVNTFKKEGFAVFEAKNGVEALEIINSKQVDIVVSDIMMPKMDGLDLCKHIKENSEASHIPVILLSAKSDVESKIGGLEIGADAYITKPFKFKHILAMVNNLLESREQLRKKYMEEPFTKITSLAHTNHDKKFVEKVVNIIEEHLSDLNFSVEYLSSELAMSRSGLHKKLKTVTGQSPNELIRTIRLKKAVLLLQEGEKNVSEVAYVTGFNSSSYFTKCFTEQFNKTPSHFIGKNHE
tara:strand:- start:46343 stop:50302 length:3960 start_codon:yes stop_codon:yes gene_type:complete